MNYDRDILYSEKTNFFPSILISKNHSSRTVKQHVESK